MKAEQEILRKDFDCLREFVSAQFTTNEKDESDSEVSDVGLAEDSEITEIAENEDLQHLTQDSALVNIDLTTNITNKNTNEINEVADINTQTTEPKNSPTTAAKTKAFYSSATLTENTCD